MGRKVRLEFKTYRTGEKHERTAGQARKNIGVLQDTAWKNTAESGKLSKGDRDFPVWQVRPPTLRFALSSRGMVCALPCSTEERVTC